MNPIIEHVIHNYLGSIAVATQLLVANQILLPTSDKEWCKIKLTTLYHDSQKVVYRKHGYGLEVRINDLIIDFDFGINGQTTGFDLWRLTSYIEQNSINISPLTINEFELLFNEAVASGHIIKFDRLFYLKNE